MDQVSIVINTLLQIPAEVWFVILGAAGVSFITQIVKRVLSLESEKTIMAVFTSIAFIASGIDYLASSHNLPPTMLGVNTAFIMGIATPLYTYVIKPMSIFISDVKAFKADTIAKVKEVEALNIAASLPNAEIVPAAQAKSTATSVIETPLPVGTTLPPSDVADF